MIFSPKNKPVNKQTALRQVRNNLKDLFQDLNKGPISPNKQA